MKWKNMIENRQNRLLAFFDAILAIAITVLALEIVIPNLGSLDGAGRYDFLVTLTCYLISFIAMSTLWYIHTNFFSNHSLTGTASEVVLHLALLFVITLFQPLTKAIGQYPQDIWIRISYVGTFLLMYGLAVLIFVLTSEHEKMQHNRREIAKQIFTDIRNEKTATKVDERKWLLELVYALHNPEELMRAAADHLPEEYLSFMEDMKEERRISLQVSIYSTVVMAIAITVSVIGLMFSVLYCYAALAAGVMVLLLIRLFVGKKRTN